MGLTIAELANFCNDNGISLDTELAAMGATVKYIGYSKAKNVVTLDEEDLSGDNFFDIVQEVE